MMLGVYSFLVYSWLRLNQVSMTENKICKDQNVYQVIKMALSEMYINIIMLVCSKTTTDACYYTQHTYAFIFQLYSYLYLFSKTQ